MIRELWVEYISHHRNTLGFIYLNYSASCVILRTGQPFNENKSVATTSTVVSFNVFFYRHLVQ